MPLIMISVHRILQGEYMFPDNQAANFASSYAEGDGRCFFFFSLQNFVANVPQCETTEEMSSS